MADFEKKTYRNLFSLIGKSEDEVWKRLEEIKATFFYGRDDERIYFPVGDDMGYLTDTGNDDARTEGMSYGMMYCVQLNMKEEFDRIWKWAYTYMWQKEPGWDEGYFAWSCGLDGTHNSEGAAPDGEEYFAMALFFASHRWGDGEGIFEYSKHAKYILHSMIHKGEPGRQGVPMFNPENRQILFVAGIDFTDPSYHLPHFYELFALWADEEDRPFFKEAAKVSREYLVKACHPVTGMCAEYAEFDGTPMHREEPGPFNEHNHFYSDAYRTAANIGLDYEWFGVDEGQCAAPLNLIRFFDKLGDKMNATFNIDGTVFEDSILHPVGLRVTTTEGLLAALKLREAPFSDDPEVVELAKKWLSELWNTPLREGKRRYYDNCLYLFAFLALGGFYRIW